MPQPRHHIDTSVILESEKTIDGRFCRRYLLKLPHNYNGVFSSPVMSELMISMLTLKEFEKRHRFLDILTNVMENGKIEVYMPQNIGELLTKIKDIDSRLQPTDIEIVACAVENEALNLITLDKKLIGNKTLEREFGLKISHPKDLL